MNICWGHQWTGPRLFTIAPGVPPPDSKLSAISKLIRQNTELESIAWSRQGGYTDCIIWGFAGQGCLTPKQRASVHRFMVIFYSLTLKSFSLKKISRVHVLGRQLNLIFSRTVGGFLRGKVPVSAQREVVCHQLSHSLKLFPPLSPIQAEKVVIRKHFFGGTWAESQLGIWLQLRSPTCCSWVQAPHQACCCQHRACLGSSLSLSLLIPHLYSLKNKQLKKKKRKKAFLWHPMRLFPYIHDKAQNVLWCISDALSIPTPCYHCIPFPATGVSR